MPLFRRVSIIALLLALAPAASAEAVSVRQLPGKSGCFELDGKYGCRKGNGTEFVLATAVSPDGRNVYAASGDAEFGALLSFRRDRRTGSLTQLRGKTGCISSTGRGQQDFSQPQSCAKASGLPGASDVEVSPDGLTVYTLARAGFDDGQAVDVWRRDPSSGTVTQIQCLTANAGFPGCDRAPIDLPEKFALTPDGSQLVVAGSALTTFPVGPDGRLGTGTCRYKLETNPANLCDTAPRLTGIRAATRIATSPDGTRVYLASATDRAVGQISVLDLAADGALTLRRCAGDPKPGLRCRAAHGIDNPQDIAVSPDGRAVYTAASLFVITDEEQSTGHTRSSAVGVFRDDLAQIGGKRGCILLNGSEHVRGCARPPRSRRPGFSEAGAIAITPNGRYALAGFSGDGAVALMRRDARTRVLRPLSGRGGCVSDGSPRSCGPGHGITAPNQISFAPDGRTAYVSTAGGLSIFSVR